MMPELTDAQRKIQVQAYVAEYQAMMTRNNWFMSLQFMPLVPLVGFFSFIAIVHKSLDPILVTWGTAGVMQIAVLIYYFALHEVYNHVRYIETKLKPKVALLLQLNTDSFWGWEGHLKQFGKANDPRFGDLVPAALSAIAFVAAGIIAVTRTPASGCDYLCISGWDFLGMVATGLLLLGAVVLARRVVKVRGEFEAAA